MPLLSSHGWAINAFRLIQMVIVLCPLGQVTGQEESKTQSPAQVLQDLLIRHGDNSTITVPQLRALLELLSQGQKKGDGNGSTTQSPATTSTRANISRVRLLKKHHIYLSKPLRDLSYMEYHCARMWLGSSIVAQLYSK